MSEFWANYSTVILIAAAVIILFIIIIKNIFRNINTFNHILCIN